MFTKREFGNKLAVKKISQPLIYYYAILFLFVKVSQVHFLLQSSNGADFGNK